MEANAELITALRNAAPSLLDDADALAGALAEVERLRAVMGKARDILDGVERRMIDAGQTAETDEDEDWWGDTVEEVRGAIDALAGPAPQHPQKRALDEQGDAQGPKSTNDAEPGAGGHPGAIAGENGRVCGVCGAPLERVTTVAGQRVWRCPWGHAASMRGGEG